MKKKISINTLRIAILILTSLSQTVSGQQPQKHRLFVLSDIEAEPDDSESFVRLMLYSNVIDIEGLVATTSCWHKDVVNPESIRKIVRAYGEVQANLLLHETGFPSSGTLLNMVKSGFPKYGMEGVGEGKDSEGSDWLIKALEKEDDRPLWVTAWGGANNLAQALYKLRKTKSKAELDHLISKLRVYTISDQDDSGIWLRNNFPNLFYIVSPGDHYASATWSAINTVVSGIDNEKISNDWLHKNIQQGHGSLGALYPDVAWGMEGDTPSFLSLIPTGLSNPEHPNWGGWGGGYEFYLPDFSKQEKGGSGVPYEPETRKIWTNANDIYTPYVSKKYGRAVKKDTITFDHFKASLWRWRDDFQNDFAARMDWCTQRFENANHPPVPILNHPENLTVKSGEGLVLEAFDSYDPDGDNLSFLWFQYAEASSYKQTVNLGAENVHGVFATAPKVDKAETIHFILKLTDKGEPALTRYKRVVVTVLPK